MSLLVLAMGNMSYNNWNGLASFKFGSVASFLTLSLLEQNFPEGLGSVCQTVEKPEGWGEGGVIAYFKKWKIRGGGGS